MVHWLLPVVHGLRSRGVLRLLTGQARERHYGTTGHYGSTGHPVIVSHEANEAWRWCFVDEQVG